MDENLTFFKETENLIDILEENFQDIEDIKKISTGWTNIVLEFTADNNKYIARFPRNDVFSKVIEKDVLVSKFLRNEIHLKTTDMNIYYDKNFHRPYSIHKKIEGESLTNRLNNLTTKKRKKITDDIALFYSKLHNININDVPDKLQNKLSDFLISISKVDNNYYDYSDSDLLKQDEEKELVFVHGDLNIGNILLDEDDDIVAFIDFAFAGLSERYSDLSRISCRVDEEFLNDILSTYEEINNYKIDYDKIAERNKMWKYIEEQYIIYMKNNFPEIKL